MKEIHLEEICAGCKKPHGNNIELLHQNHKTYEKITCENCGYIIIRYKDETAVINRFEFM